MTNKFMNKQSIQILGSGCPACKKLLKTVQKIAKELKIETDVEYITDVSEIIKMGIMTSPVLAINGKSVLTGSGHSDEEIKNVLLNSLPEEENNCSSCGCCCSNC